jgi:hypothetical protein
MSGDAKDPFSQASYEIGYGKPPVAGRFVKGKSGNPRGRPKKSAAKPSVDHSRDWTNLGILDARNLITPPLIPLLIQLGIAPMSWGPHADLERARISGASSRLSDLIISPKKPIERVT